MEMKNLMAELKEKAKAAKNPEEIQAIAKENGMEDFSLESAKAYYEQLHKEGELSDEELDNVAGGACCLYNDDGRMITTALNSCPDGFHCDVCPWDHNEHSPNCTERGRFCRSCRYLSIEQGLWLCNYKGNRYKGNRIK
ncbi:MAG: hypothetical protein MSS92_00925 [Lachnospiraceae bacterium]|nr:hypothetical protein [Lachnospiraceae bacterium]